MGTMASSNTCDPEKDYTYEECLEYGVSIDLDMLDSMIQKGTLQTKRNTYKVAILMMCGLDDHSSDLGAGVLDGINFYVDEDEEGYRSAEEVFLG